MAAVRFGAYHMAMGVVNESEQVYNAQCVTEGDAGPYISHVLRQGGV